MSLLLLLVTVVGLATAYEDKTVVECLKGNGNFSVLSALIDKAGLTSRLSSTGKFCNIFLSYHMLRFPYVTSRPYIMQRCFTLTK